MTYTHLNKEERHYLCQNLKSKKSLRQIAKEIKRNACNPPQVSTIQQ